MDYFSRWTESIQVPDFTMITVGRNSSESVTYIYRFDDPKTIMNYNGIPFKIGVLYKLHPKYQIK